jgi:dipeptide transport system ATP-binding protein
MVAVVEARALTRDYNVAGGFLSANRVVRAVKGISFTLEAGKTLAIVGESGSGKSTLARILTLIDRQSSGELRLNGEPIDIGKAPVTKALRRKVQMVFQNPYGSLNPRQKIGDVLMEPLLLNTDLPAQERRDRAMDMLVKVGLEPQHFERYPHMFSGGQRQRIAIARAIIMRPALLVLDEPVSALDLSVQAQILNLLADLQDEFGLTYIFISHDLSVVRYIADEVMVMYLGEAVEQASRDRIFANPEHPYTQALFQATPKASISAIRARLAARSGHANVTG